MLGSKSTIHILRFIQYGQLPILVGTALILRQKLRYLLANVYPEMNAAEHLIQITRGEICNSEKILTGLERSR